jgi:membrane protease YdiL (CAAX protease family)
MDKFFPPMMDRPEKGISVAAFIYGVLCFFSLPFLIFLLMTGLHNNTQAMTWCDIVYHCINFCVALGLYHGYLADTFFFAGLNWKTNLKTVLLCAVAVLCFYQIAASVLTVLGQSDLAYLIQSILPATEMELFNLDANVVYTNPLFGTLCMVFLAPFATSCIYYASTFAPVCCSKPWLAYPAMALVLALPRIANAMTLWDPATEMILYFSQLPIHMVACWAYQKTDNIWTPIALHSVLNLIGCIAVLYFRFLAV